MKCKDCKNLLIQEKEIDNLKPTTFFKCLLTLEIVKKLKVKILNCNKYERS